MLKQGAIQQHEAIQKQGQFKRQEAIQKKVTI